jgi:hypothetical protein
MGPPNAPCGLTSVTMCRILPAIASADSYSLAGFPARLSAVTLHRRHNALADDDFRQGVPFGRTAGSTRIPGSVGCLQPVRLFAQKSSLESL